MVDMNGFLAQKYAILGQHAAAAQTAAAAAMQNARNEAALVGARGTLMGSQAGEGQQRGKLYGAEAGKVGVETAWLPKTYAAEIGYKNAAARSTNMGASVLGNDTLTGTSGGLATGNATIVDPVTGLSMLNPNPYGAPGTRYGGMPAPNVNPVASMFAPPAAAFAHADDWKQLQQPDPAPAAPNYGAWGAPAPGYAEGTSNVQAPAAPNYGAWGAPAQTPQPSFGFPAMGMGMPLVPIAPSSIAQGQGVAAGQRFAGAGYADGVPVPSGGTAYSASGMSGGPGGSQNTRDPWGLTTPMGHSRVTGAEGSWDEAPSTPVTTSIDGQRPQRLSKPGAMGGYNKHPYVAGGNSRPVAPDQLDYMGGHPEDFNYAKGTSKVPGKGSKGKAAPAKGGGKTLGKGMVEAGLAPGEAVLTPGAADRMGRDNIGMLNAMAHHGMLPSQGTHLGGQPHAAQPQSVGALPGLPPPAMMGGKAPAGPQGKPQGFAEGTSNVQSQPEGWPQIHERAATWANGVANSSAAPHDQGGSGVRRAWSEPAQHYAKGTSAVSAGDSIGAPMRLQQSALGGKPTPDLKLAKGTSKVPGKPTNPSKDTQHGQIPVGGAVLTNDAANHVGRGLIAHLNQMHGGMPQPGFAGGTANVQQPINNFNYGVANRPDISGTSSLPANAANWRPVYPSDIREREDIGPNVRGPAAAYAPPHPQHYGNAFGGGMPQPGFAEGTADVPETNGQHLMGQIGSAWNWATTPNPNADLAVGMRGLVSGVQNTRNKLAPGIEKLRGM